VGGALAFDVAWIFAAFLLILVLIASGIATRRFLLERGGGTVDCGLRRTSGQGSWRLGVASYQGDQLCWYHLFGILLRPRLELERRTLTVASRRAATVAESASLGPGMVVVECTVGDGNRVELAMSEAALTGFLSWLEAAPPGSYLDQIA
jgi:Protein of unknown function (DUF2550)